MPRPTGGVEWCCAIVVQQASLRVHADVGAGVLCMQAGPTTGRVCMQPSSAGEFGDAAAHGLWRSHGGSGSAAGPRCALGTLCGRHSGVVRGDQQALWVDAALQGVGCVRCKIAVHHGSICQVDAHVHVSTTPVNMTARYTGSAAHCLPAVVQFYCHDFILLNVTLMVDGERFELPSSLCR